MSSPAQEPQPSAHAPGTASGRAARRYRILFWIAAALGMFAAYDAWRSKRQMREMDLVDVDSFSRKRDVKYPFVVDAYGFKYRGVSGNMIDEQIMLFGLYEKDHLFFLRDYLKNAAVADAVAIDVGANTGNHTFFLSRHTTHVHAFEPFPPVIQKFRDNQALNPGITNVTLYEVALGDVAGEMPFLAPPENNHGNGTLRVEVAKDTNPEREYRVKVVRGDDALRDRLTGTVVVLKIDVEGAEEIVLKGLAETMKKHRPLVNVEVSAPPWGTITSFDALRQLLPENYEYLVLDRSLDGGLFGRYLYHRLTPADFQSGQVEVVAYPHEREAAVPRSGGGK